MHVKIDKYYFILGVLASPDANGKYRLTATLSLPFRDKCDIDYIGSLDRGDTEYVIKNIKLLYDSPNFNYEFDWDTELNFSATSKKKYTILAFGINNQSYEIETKQLFQILKELSLFFLVIKEESEQLIDKAIDIYFSSEKKEVFASENPHFFNIPIKDYDIDLVVSLGFKNPKKSISKAEYKKGVHFDKIRKVSIG